MRLCPKHALQLNYRKNKEVLKLQHKQHKRQLKKQQKQDRKRRKHDSTSDDQQPISNDQQEDAQAQHDEIEDDSPTDNMMSNRNGAEERSQPAEEAGLAEGQLTSQELTGAQDDGRGQPPDSKRSRSMSGYMHKHANADANADCSVSPGNRRQRDAGGFQTNQRAGSGDRLYAHALSELFSDSAMLKGLLV